MIFRNRSLVSWLPNSETSEVRSSIWPTRKNSRVPKNSKSPPAAGVTKATIGSTKLDAGVVTLTAPLSVPNSVVCNSRSDASGRSSTVSRSLMVAPISGARPIHSLSGPASMVAARPSAPSPRATMTRLVSHGGMPRRLAALTSGASVTATIEAARIGNRMARPI